VSRAAISLKRPVEAGPVPAYLEDCRRAHRNKSRWDRFTDAYSGTGSPRSGAEAGGSQQRANLRGRHSEAEFQQLASDPDTPPPEVPSPSEG
jgi:hypothetical protein